MTCDELSALLPAYADGELDLVRHLDVEQHLSGCCRCAEGCDKLSLLRAALQEPSFRFEPPPGLAGRVKASLRDRAPAGRRLWLPLSLAAAAALCVLAWGLIQFGSARAREDLLAREVVASHVRSLLVINHLTDVASSDQHTVKPWFQKEARLDFSLPVRDLAGHGFRLLGGRVDYCAGRRVAALVYQRRQHTINLLVWPEAAASEREPEPLTCQGYQLLHWSQDGLSLWAVSDLNSAELRTFVELVRQQ